MNTPFNRYHRAGLTYTSGIPITQSHKAHRGKASAACRFDVATVYLQRCPTIDVIESASCGLVGRRFSLLGWRDSFNCRIDSLPGGLPNPEASSAPPVVLASSPRRFCHGCMQKNVSSVSRKYNKRIESPNKLLEQTGTAAMMDRKQCQVMGTRGTHSSCRRSRRRDFCTRRQLGGAGRSTMLSPQQLREDIIVQKTPTKERSLPEQYTNVLKKMSYPNAVIVTKRLGCPYLSPSGRLACIVQDVSLSTSTAVVVWQRKSINALGTSAGYSHV